MVRVSYILVITILMSMLTGCNAKKEVKQEDSPNQEITGHRFFVGTYTDGESEGIYRFQLNPDGMILPIGLAAKSDNPSFLAYSTDRKYLMAVNEISDENQEGSVESFAVKGDQLEPMNKSSSGGAHPCHISVNEKGVVVVANYTGGNVGLLKLDNTGILSALLDVEQHEGKGTTSRQEGPHAHSAWFDPASNGIISVDLGTDELWLSSIEDDKLQLNNKYSFAKGSGPRHLTFHPNAQWVYVLNELSCTVSHLIRSPESEFSEVSAISTLPTEYTEENTCADIHITSNGKFLFASNRGHNSIVSYRVNSEDGSLTLIGFTPTEGDHPRNFALSPDEKFLIVANQKTNNLVSFEINEDGSLTKIDEKAAPSPVCVLF